MSPLEATTIFLYVVIISTFVFVPILLGNYLGKKMYRRLGKEEKERKQLDRLKGATGVY